MAMKIPNYLVIIKDARSYIYIREPGDPPQSSNSNFGY